jgi:hypothetical protein
MSITKMIVPKTISVGYQSRKDTYTGKLAYVIYTDDKGVLRKEKSWNSWRTKNLGRDDFNNEPTSGFVLNKGVGGARMSYGWNARNEYIRVYDPRNFEFEISVHNLLFILQECSAIKGKGLEGEFVYAWDGTTLVLLPVGCKEYDECLAHTKRQTIKFDKKDIKEGYSYLMKDGTEVLYLGRHQYNHYSPYSSKYNPAGLKHVFQRLGKLEQYNPLYFPETGFKKIAEVTSSGPLSNFANAYEKFKKSNYCGDIKKFRLKKETFVTDKYGATNLIYRPLLLKEDNKYHAAKLDYDHHNSYRRQYDKFMLIKSEKLFNLDEMTLENASKFFKDIQQSLIDSPFNQGGLTKERLENMDFYVITAVTEQGAVLEMDGRI